MLAGLARAQCAGVPRRQRCPHQVPAPRQASVQVVACPGVLAVLGWGPCFMVASTTTSYMPDCTGKPNPLLVEAGHGVCSACD